tara:strand:- start:424 stop:567 length:144 start_codon:yes stop_codon:yes gene_type:complete
MTIFEEIKLMAKEDKLLDKRLNKIDKPIKHYIDKILINYIKNNKGEL